MTNPARKIEPTEKPGPTEAEQLFGRVLGELVQNAVESKLANIIDRITENLKPKLAYDIKEAAQMISVPDSWLATKARAGELRSTRFGLYVTVTPADLAAFVEKMRESSVPLKRKRRKKTLTGEVQ